MVIDDLVWVTARLDATPTEGQLAARIIAGVKPGGQIDLSPRSAAEQDLLAAALSDLVWERRGGQLVRRLRDAVLDYPVDTAQPLDEPAAVTLDGDLTRLVRAASSQTADRG
jgi:hypothetical protein